MKYLVLIPDGMADWKIEMFENRTPLEVAETPNMDYIAKEGACGLAKTVPKGFEPGSDIANLTILGIDVRKYYTGRGPIEALARGIKGKIVFRCNLVKVEGNRLLDYSGGRISDSEAKAVIKTLNLKKPWDYVTFHAGRSYRNLCTINKDLDANVQTTPPHDIQDKDISDYLPKNGELAELLLEIMEWSRDVLPDITEKANMVWLWGGGKMPNFPKFSEIYGLKAAMLSEVDLLIGIGKGLGMDILEVEGLTGYIDTNYRGIVRRVVRSIEDYDLIVLHTEGIDEVSHEGKADLKVEAIELYDEKIVGKILDKIDLEETRILLLPDHPTPVKVRTHVSEPVPFAILGIKRDDVKTYSERSCAKGKFGLINGINLMKVLSHQT